MSDLKDIFNPWLNSDGTRKADDEIRKISKDWDPATWEAYLQTHERRLKEVLLHGSNDIENFSVNAVAVLFDMAESESNPHLKRAVQIALNKLSNRENQILRLVFWDGKTTRDIAEELNISRFNVRRALERGLIKIREIFVANEIPTTAEISKNLAAHLQPILQPRRSIGRDGYTAKETSLPLTPERDIT
ncbi:MAG: hypothetical protein JWQ35_309 [Bacteriovoracaceae bacterium]|nr:hypothetical protein [Bacteriovoracaceae bacterium]